MTTKIIDSIMGSGKTTFMIKYMKSNPDKKFFVVTPFLSEIERIKEEVSFLREPKQINNESKSQNLSNLIFEGHSIVTTHKMFSKLPLKTIEKIKKGEYILILDEVVNVLTPWNFETKDDEKNFFSHYGYLDNDNLVCWNNDKNNPDDYSYKSAFHDVMHLANNQSLIKHKNGKYIIKLPAQLFEAFKETYILTYMFKGSLQKNYFDLYGIEYELYSIKEGNLVPYEPLSKEEREKLASLITIIDNDKMNFEDYKENNLFNVTWYKKNKMTKRIKKHLTNFFKNKCDKGDTAKDKIISTFKDYEEKLCGKRFIPFNSRATNEFNHVKNLAYLVNVYPNGDISSFLGSKGCTIDKEHYALSTLIQTVFRTRIRNFHKSDEERTINLYIPSKRMRNLLIKWLNNEIK